MNQGYYKLKEDTALFVPLPSPTAQHNRQNSHSHFRIWSVTLNELFLSLSQASELQSPAALSHTHSWAWGIRDDCFV